MLTFDNSEEVSRILDRFNAHKSTEIPPELGEYINHVAKTGDTVYRWSTIRLLFREKIKTVIKEFQDTTTSIEGALNSSFLIFFFSFLFFCNFF